MGEQAPQEPRMGLGGMRAPMTSAKPLAGQIAPPTPARNVRQPLVQPVAPQPVRTVRQPIGAPPLQPQTELPEQDTAGEEVGTLPAVEASQELPAEEVTSEVLQPEEPVDDDLLAVEEQMAEGMELEEEVQEQLLETESLADGPGEAVQEVMVEAESVEAFADEETDVTEASSTTMTRPTTLLKPIRGVLKPLEDEEPVRTATLTPVGHMLMPEKRRGTPPASAAGQPPTAVLRPVKGTLKPVSKAPAKVLKPQSDDDDASES